MFHLSTSANRNSDIAFSTVRWCRRKASQAALRAAIWYLLAAHSNASAMLVQRAVVHSQSIMQLINELIRPGQTVSQSVNQSINQSITSESVCIMVIQRGGRGGLGPAEYHQSPVHDHEICEVVAVHQRVYECIMVNQRGVRCR